MSQMLDPTFYRMPGTSNAPLPPGGLGGADVPQPLTGAAVSAFPVLAAAGPVLLALAVYAAG